MRAWDERRAALEEAKPHYASSTAAIISAVVAAAASAYGASQQAAAAKKAKLAQANAALAGGGGGGGNVTTVASQTKDVGGGELGKSIVAAADYGQPDAKVPTGRSYSDMLGSSVAANPVTPQRQPDVFPAADQKPNVPDVPYNEAVGLNAQGTRDKTPDKVSGYADMASSALPLILALTQGHPPQAQPLARPSPYSYVPTAARYRDLIQGGGF